jgi:glutathione reductase (NADPH)
MFGQPREQRVDQLDLIVLGTGPASGAAMACAKQGWHVGIVDPRPVGGTCALRGCNPKKVLVRAAELRDWANRMAARGILRDPGPIQWQRLIQFKRSFTQPITPANEKAYAEAGVEQFHGEPSFTGRQTLVVNGKKLRAKKMLIATGASPRELPIDGKEHLITSDQFLEADRLPVKDPILFVGGGYISFEFAHAAARAGTEVVILEMNERPLSLFDADLVKLLVDRSKQVGIRVETGTKVERVEQVSDHLFRVYVVNGDEMNVLSAGMVVHGAGREPNLKALNLDAAGIRYDRQGIHVNEHLQSVSNPDVYAAGDVAATGAPPLTPVASEDGRVVERNLLEGNRLTPDYGTVPSAVYSVPALASVGLTEEQAIAQNKNYELRTGDWSQFNSMKKLGETHAMYKVLIDRSSDQILGAHLLGQDAAETINVFALAMKFQITATQLKSVLFTFPSLVYDIRSMV